MLRIFIRTLLIESEYRYPFLRPASKFGYLPDTLGPLAPAGKLIGKDWAVSQSDAALAYRFTN